MQQQKVPNALVLRGVNLVDGVSGSLKKDVTITVEDGIITGIGNGSAMSIPPNASVIDLPGRTVIPGLIDAHLHLSQSGVDDFVKPYAERMQTKLTRNALLTLKSGVTTVRNMPGGSGDCVFRFRKRVERGEVVGPRILASGPALAPSYGYFSLKRFFPPNPAIMGVLSRIFGAHGLSVDVDTQEEARTTILKLKAHGVDFIKTVTPGAYIAFAEKDEAFKNELLKKGVNKQMIEASMKPEVLEAIVEQAHAVGLKVAAHTISWPEDFKEAVKAGVDSIEHTPLGILDDEAFELMKQNNTYWVPTAYIFSNWCTFIDNPEEYDSAEMKQRIPEPFHSLGKKALDKVRKGIKSGDDPLWSRFYAEIKPFYDEYFPTNLQRAREKGIKIVAAVDAGASGAGYVPHGWLYKELEIFVAHGMTEFEALQTATKNPAELLGLERKLGTIEIGKVGDFVVLDANPLDNIANLKRVHTVVKEGAVVYTGGK